MKKIIFGIVLLLITSIIITSCSSPKKALQRGDYYNATMQAVKRLRTSPNNKKSQDVLLRAYPLAKENGLRKIKNATDMNTADKYSIVADEYIALNEMANAIYECPKALELIQNPTQYSKELGKILPLSAEEAYENGIKLLQLNTIQDAREAYYYFLKADKYVSGYRDVNDKIREALYIATLKVVVQKPITSQKYQYSADFFYNNLMAQISQITKNGFTRFYTHEEAQKENLKQPDQWLILDFDDFSIGNIRESKNSFEVTRDSVLVGTTNVNGVTQNVYGTVKAKMTTNRREVISQGKLSARIVDAVNNRIIEHKDFPGRFVWYNEWASYKGDERALSDKQKKMTNTEPVMPPPQQDLFIEFTKPIFDQTVNFVKNFYSKYEEKNKYQQ